MARIQITKTSMKRRGSGRPIGSKDKQPRKKRSSK